MTLKYVMIGAIIAMMLAAIVPDYNNVNASGFGRCEADEPEDSTFFASKGAHIQKHIV
jgi:hypothetical protein